MFLVDAMASPEYSSQASVVISGMRSVASVPVLDQYGGVMAVVYRHGDAGTLRIHVDRGLASYLWEWFECQPLLAQG